MALPKACASGLALLLATWAMASSGEAKRAYQVLCDFRTQLTNAAPKTAEGARLVDERVRSKAQELAKDVDSQKIEPDEAVDWAKFYDCAQMPAEALSAARLALGGKLAAQPRNETLLLVARVSAKFDDGKSVSSALRQVSPSSVNEAVELCRWVAATVSLTTRGNSVPEVLGLIQHAEDSLATIAHPIKPGSTTDGLAKEVHAQLTLARLHCLTVAARKSDALALIDEELSRADASARTKLVSYRTQLGLTGALAPELAFGRNYGEFTNLNALRGKVVVIHFCAHWCSPCRSELPELKKLQDELGPKGLQVVGVTTYYGYYKDERHLGQDVEFAKMAEFVKEFNVSWPLLFGDRTNFETYGVSGIPQIVLVDRRGDIRKIQVGFSAESFPLLRTEIERVLSE